MSDVCTQLAHRMRPYHKCAVCVLAVQYIFIGSHVRVQHVRMHEACLHAQCDVRVVCVRSVCMQHT
jgi:hypothetical protein